MQEFGLENQEHDPAILIRGKMSESWANLIDTQAVKLKRFGDVDSKLASVLDPSILRLAQLALELARVFDGDTAQ